MSVSFPPPDYGKVYVLLVNWQGWPDTIACLESLWASDYRNFAAVVVDNGSRDDSLARIEAWAQDARLPADPDRRFFLRTYSRAQSEQLAVRQDPGAPLVLIRSNDNLGFAGGNNVGLRYIGGRQDAAYVWVLNNDTVVAPAALRLLLHTAAADPRIGAVGATVLYADAPRVINAAGGGRIIKCLGITRLNRESQTREEAIRSSAEPPLDYIYGASCLVRLETVRKVGLMAEGFFHFWEDVDWCMRMTRAGYRLAYAPGSLIYHKRGSSIPFRSSTADYYEMRNGIIFYRQYYGVAFLGVHLLKFLAACLNRLRRRQPERIPLLAQALYHGLIAPVASTAGK